MPEKRYKLGMTWGGYDVLHIGHINLFKNAKELVCEELVVCVSSDAYLLKHKGRAPVVPFVERVAMVRAIKYVDYVQEQTLLFGKKEAIEQYKPDVLIVGSDWTPETYEGEGLGVPVVYLPHTDGTSSTLLREKLLKMG